MKIATQRFAYFAAGVSLAFTAAGTPSVLTQDYDMSRSAANLSEVILAPSNVSSSTFGKLFSYPVDEEVFGQPLYMPALAIAGGTHNVVFVATMGNSVYAFDADNASTSTAPLWSVNLGTPVPTAKYKFVGGSGVSHDGIYSTPVIDPTTNTLYAVTHQWSTADQTVSMQLHALDVTTGSEKFGGPVVIAAPAFNADINEQRAGLLLLNGVVYVAMASHADIRSNIATNKGEPYYGMILAYNAATLSLESSFNVDAGGLGGSIWQGGRGPVSDGSYVYAATANAFKLGKPDYSESFVQLNPGTLTLASYYQDPDVTCLNTLDLDLASSGPQLIPGAGTNLLVGGGKEAKIYVLQLNQSLTTQTPQYFWGANNHPTLPAEGGTCTDSRSGNQGYLMGSDSAFWNNPGGTSYYYAFANRNELYSWQVSGNTFTQTSADDPTSTYLNALVVSANGGSNGILWAVTGQTNAPTAIVSAYNGTPSAGHLPLLWSSTQDSNRDAPGQPGRYSVPTVVNGKVYVATGSNQVAVYGLLPSTASVVATPKSATLDIVDLNSATDVVEVNSIAGYAGTVSMSLQGLPAGMTYSFAKPTVTLKANASVGNGLTISPASAVLPLNDNYTVVVEATTASGVTSYAPIRLLTRSAKYTSQSSAGCNASNQMNASIAWQIAGSAAPAIWIQDPTTPTFPGRLWEGSLSATGSTQTGYVIDDHTQNYAYWIIDQSAGLPAIFDNTFAVAYLNVLYDCP